jgi:hypothetical protein
VKHHLYLLITLINPQILGTYQVFGSEQRDDKQVK